jgi:hypothetical protein
VPCFQPPSQPSSHQVLAITSPDTLLPWLIPGPRLRCSPLPAHDPRICGAIFGPVSQRSSQLQPSRQPWSSSGSTKPKALHIRGHGGLTFAARLLKQPAPQLSQSRKVIFLPLSPILQHPLRATLRSTHPRHRSLAHHQKRRDDADGNHDHPAVA